MSLRICLSNLDRSIHGSFLSYLHKFSIRWWITTSAGGTRIMANHSAFMAGWKLSPLRKLWNINYYTQNVLETVVEKLFNFVCCCCCGLVMSFNRVVSRKLVFFYFVVDCRTLVRLSFIHIYRTKRKITKSVRSFVRALLWRSSWSIKLSMKKVSISRTICGSRRGIRRWSEWSFIHFWSPPSLVYHTMENSFSFSTFIIRRD